MNQEKFHQIHLVIMAGGSGTRFWPKSRQEKPKQLLSFTPDGETLIEKTLKRFEGWISSSQKWIVTTELLAQSMNEAVKDDRIRILPEPQGRNTAPCVFWAAKEVEKKDPEAIMLVVPADHWIEDMEAFNQTVKEACLHARQSSDLVTLGIRPTRPETGYGYLKIKPSQTGAQKVESFVEKPDVTRAKQYFESNQYLWNGGMFVWKVSAILKAFDEWMPEMAKAWADGSGKISDVYPKMTATSIDFGVMEKAKNVVTFPLDCGWDDLGNWTSVESLYKRLGYGSEDGVVLAGDVISIDSSRNIVDVPNRLIALLGVDDFIIVDNGKSLLIAKKEKSQKIKSIVSDLKKRHPELI